MHKRPQTIEQVDLDEHKLAEVHKHPFGIIVIYVQTFVAMLAAATLLFLIVPSLFEEQETGYFVSGMFMVFTGLIACVVLSISTYIYRQNCIIITDRNITQILQYGLFSRKVSQLNIVNVEDVTSVQHGFISTLFNFGVLKIETAGEQANFHFAFCPNSGYVAKVILEAREKMLGQKDKTPGSDSSDSLARARRANVDAFESTNSRSNNRMRGVGAEVIERVLEPPDNK